jgi:hypothetical protein
MKHRQKKGQRLSNFKVSKQGLGTLTPNKSLLFLGLFFLSIQFLCSHSEASRSADHYISHCSSIACPGLCRSCPELMGHRVPSTRWYRVPNTEVPRIFWFLGFIQVLPVRRSTTQLLRFRLPVTGNLCNPLQGLLFYLYIL